MGTIFRFNQSDLAWSDYASDAGRSAIRFKAVTAGARGVPSVQYIEYGPGQTDPVHRHDRGEFFIVTTGAMWIDDEETGPGGVVYIPPDTDYAVRAGASGVEYFRVVAD
jgi:quercetin dioxygenase-like cupin family protein